MEWKPIETAPKDRPILVCGGEILLDGGEIEYSIYEKKWNIPMIGKHWYDCKWEQIPTTYNHITINPTHWMELPELPKE